MKKSDHIRALLRTTNLSLSEIATQTGAHYGQVHQIAKKLEEEECDFDSTLIELLPAVGYDKFEKTLSKAKLLTGVQRKIQIRSAFSESCRVQEWKDVVKDITQCDIIEHNEVYEFRIKESRSILNENNQPFRYETINNLHREEAQFVFGISFAMEIISFVNENGEFRIKIE